MAPQAPSTRRCAIYTRKSSPDGLEQEFNSLQAQREACEAYIKSQAHEGWALRRSAYDDGGISGGHTDRPALQKLLRDVKRGLVDVVLVYKVDRLSRSLGDFAQLIDLFDSHGVAFVSVTQQFNTSNSMGRLTLNVLLSFAQFEREVTGERIRDKIAASKRKGMWMGGTVPLGYDVEDKRLTVNSAEAETVQHIHRRYLALGCVRKLKAELDAEGYVSKQRTNGSGGKPFSRGALYTLLKNPLYAGRVAHRDEHFPGQHEAILDDALWDQVQERLRRNRSKARRRSASKAPSLLAGLLFDDQGNAMSPTHATKGKRRYRYYISQAVLKFEAEKEGSVVRAPAAEVEKAVCETLIDYLGDPHRLLESATQFRLSADVQSKIVEAAKTATNELRGRGSGPCLKLFGEALKRVELASHAIQAEILPGRLLSRLGIDVEPQKPEKAHVLRGEIAIKRVGMETKLVVAPRSSAQPHPKSQAAIQKAVARALIWNDELLSGRAKTVKELAEKEQVNPRYLSGMLKLGWLDPEVTRTILQGRPMQPVTLSRLKEISKLAWPEQRAAVLG